MRMTVGKKLNAAFIAVLLLMGVVGAIGINSMSTMNTKTKDITGNWMIGVDDMDTLSYLSMKIRARELQILIEPDQSKIKSYVDDIQLTVNQMN